MRCKMSVRRLLLAFFVTLANLLIHVSASWALTPTGLNKEGSLAGRQAVLPGRAVRGGDSRDTIGAQGVVQRGRRPLLGTGHAEHRPST